MKVNDPRITNEKVLELWHSNDGWVLSGKVICDGFYDLFFGGKHEFIDNYIRNLKDKPTLIRVYNYLLSCKKPKSCSK